MPLKSLIKILISAGMLFLVLRLTDFSKLVAAVRELPGWAIVTVVLGYLCGQILSSFKWWLIARSAGVNVPWSSALKSYFIGAFVNSFGLGLVGGDVARGVLLGMAAPQDGTTQPRTAALASVVADRVQGLAVLLAIGLITSFLVVGHALDQSLRNLVLGVAVALVIVWYTGSSLILKVLPRNKKLHEIFQNVTRAFPRSPVTLGAITAISFVFHMSQIGLNFVMLYALGIEIPWTQVMIAIPFVNILASLPISWNGLGVREKSYLFFLAPALAPDQAVVLGALWLFALTFNSAVGGIISVWTGDFGKLRDLKKN